MLFKNIKNQMQFKKMQIKLIYYPKVMISKAGGKNSTSINNRQLNDYWTSHSR